MEMPLWYQSFIIERKASLIRGWLEEVDTRYPGRYNLKDLETNGLVYFELLTELHVPLEKHPQFQIIPMLCQYHAALSTPVTQLLESSYIWRKCLGDLLVTYALEREVSPSSLYQIINILNTRIDLAQKYITDIYWDRAVELISEQKRTIQELHEDRLTLLGKMAASMAHEIRNPLTAIEGFLKLLRNEAGAEGSRAHHYLDIMQGEIKSLFSHITGLLHFSKNNGFEEEFTQCSISGMITGVMELLSPRLIEEGIELKVSVDVTSPVTVQRTAIQQVLTNIISNGIDALSDQEGERIITICSYEDDSQYYIGIANNGPGIPEYIKAKLFTPFVTTKPKGTGIGLSICKQIMDKNKGDIHVHSTPSETVFTLSLVKDCGLEAQSEWDEAVPI